MSENLKEDGPKLSQINSEQSIPANIAIAAENSQGEEEEQYIQVAAPSKTVLIDDLQAEKMIGEIKRKEQERKEALEKIQKNALKKKKSEAIN